jgi:CheY-like chemotaxis protein
VELPREIIGAHILLVEDHPINQQVAMELLGGAGFHVQLAGNGREAVDAVRTHQYNAVLMDVQMPVLDDYAATREIHAWELEAKQPPSGSNRYIEIKRLLSQRFRVRIALKRLVQLDEA